MGKKPPKSRSRRPERKGSPFARTRQDPVSMDSLIPQEKSYSPKSSKPLSRGQDISKLRGKKPLSRQQRIRRENGKARADVVLQQLERKITSSKERESKIKNRRVTWDELNNSVRAGGKESNRDVKPRNRNSTDAPTQKTNLIDHNMSENPIINHNTPNPPLDAEDALHKNQEIS